ncbi:uncharacterized protein LOC126744911 [Anthonomus grandis grandis]|uniref:uncharacterized protein LOC126744911 n=1 Tax=Anthonomus grandis grandis TaxID=2921223 RepID=UPI002164FAFF|nr:uncharacterized protein LOC126744911 [Anthonomus grandis grandis]XP_050308461.1 uncharacterized protein LOC126744911 [Anthonomus grandis grandis]
MELVVSEFEELMLCGYCKQKYNDSDLSPKLLSCKHYFCLQCTRTNMTKGQELYCVYCWKRTELGDMGPESLPTYSPALCLAKNFGQMSLGTRPPDKTPSTQKVGSENCLTHAMPLVLWCHSCGIPLCRACASTVEHTTHKIKPQGEAKEHLVAEMQIDLTSMNKMLSEIQRLAMQQREFLLKIHEACVTLKTHVESELTNNASHFEIGETRDLLAKLRVKLSMADTLTDVHNIYSNLTMEKHRLQLRYHEMYLQCQLDDLIRTASVIFDFQLLKQAFSNINHGEPLLNTRLINTNNPQQNPILFLANYCMAQLYSRHVLSKQNLDFHQLLPSQVINYHQHHLATQQDNYTAMLPSPQMRQPTNPCPFYYFNIDVNGTQLGRIVIEVRADVAPKMAKNFDKLATGEAGLSYKGCQIFQCWEGESVITGDYELNNGRGGRSIYEDGYFLPDDTKLVASRGAVGMRRTQKRHDNLGMVGSQFRIILQEMRGFTGIFGHVAEGLELVDKISTFGDTAGKPTKNIVISKCGKL